MNNDPDELLPTRWTLIERLKNWDDQESWRQFFDTYWKLIYGVAIESVDFTGTLTGTDTHVSGHVR
jgi:hypothetical protein